MTENPTNLLAVEVGEIGAWIALGWGASGVENQRRIAFAAPPTATEAVDAIISRIEEIGGNEKFAAIGIASWDIPGSKRGALASEIVIRLGAQFQAPSRIANAVEAAARAETLLGAGQRRFPVVYVHLGREVRAAIVTENGDVVGAAAGQIGHWRVAETGPRCSCGQIGHLNPLSSSQGFVRLAIGAISQDEAALAAAGAATDGRIEAITAPRAVRLAEGGIEPLRELVTISATALGAALTNLALLADPAFIVLGGPLGIAGGLFLAQTQASVSEQLQAISLDWRGAEIVPAQLEPYGALRGAWLLASDAASGV